MSILKADLVNTTRFYAADDGAVQEWTSAQVTYAIVEAVRRYGRFLPYYQKKTILTVKDQDAYLLPSNCLMLVDVDYPRSDVLAMNPYNFDDSQYHDLVLIREQLVAQVDRQQRGYWREVNYTLTSSYQAGRYVVIYPPAAANDVSLVCTYIAAHPSDSTHWISILSEHEHVIARLAHSVLLERQAEDMLRQGNWDEGQSRIQPQTPATEMLRRVDRIRQEIEDIYGYPVAGIV